VVFKGSILGGARQFWGNSYLNSTTVLFDKGSRQLICKWANKSDIQQSYGVNIPGDKGMSSFCALISSRLISSLLD